MALIKKVIKSNKNSLNEKKKKRKKKINYKKLGGGMNERNDETELCQLNRRNLSLRLSAVVLGTIII